MMPRVVIHNNPSFRVVLLKSMKDIRLSVGDLFFDEDMASEHADTPGGEAENEDESKDDEEGDYLRALLDGPWVIQGSYSLVQPWTPNYVRGANDLTAVAAWVRFPGMPFHLYHKSVLRRLAALLDSKKKTRGYEGGSRKQTVIEANSQVRDGSKFTILNHAPNDERPMQVNTKETVVASMQVNTKETEAVIKNGRKMQNTMRGADANGKIDKSFSRNASIRTRVEQPKKITLETEGNQKSAVEADKSLICSKDTEGENKQTDREVQERILDPLKHSVVSLGEKTTLRNTTIRLSPAKGDGLGERVKGVQIAKNEGKPPDRTGSVWP
ncbi:Uncharacterized protein TCM_017272 [Theobroma cacao]|uniref:Uncharacterized protein n=1 Tax=Theobroma cacao TaxID=3641 RepID=A0A061EDZ6_THECC|nr:Uncharacterized protein TCM_017272 [Theobroma cacao]